MTEEYDAIIIGSGIGGLAAGLLLAHQGMKILVLEQHRFIGGKLSSFDRDGFHCDLGVHLISRGERGPVGDVFTRVGLPDPIRWSHVRPQSSYQGNIYTFPRDLRSLVPEKDFEGLMQFLQGAMAMPESDTKAYDDTPLKDYLSPYTRDPICQGWVESISLIYVGSALADASTGEFLRCLKWEAAAKASGYPNGGCDAISNAYGDGIRKFGGELRFRAKVQSVEVTNSRVTGVVVGNEVYRSDLVVSNAGIKTTVFDLVGSEHFSSEYTEYVEALRYTTGFGMTARIALDKRLTDIHMLGHIAEFDKVAQAKRIREGVIPDELNLMVVVPSNFSPNLVPKGKQYVCVIGNVEGGFPEQYRKEITDATLRTTETIIPGLKEHTLWVSTMTRDDLNKMMYKGGAAIGIAQIVGQVGDKRPKIKTPLEGLYLVGGDAGGSGVGIELCINSAFEFIDNYCPAL